MFEIQRLEGVSIHRENGKLPFGGWWEVTSSKIKRSDHGFVIMDGLEVVSWLAGQISSKIKVSVN